VEENGLNAGIVVKKQKNKKQQQQPGKLRVKCYVWFTIISGFEPQRQNNIYYAVSIPRNSQDGKQTLTGRLFVAAKASIMTSRTDGQTSKHVFNSINHIRIKRNQLNLYSLYVLTQISQSFLLSSVSNRTLNEHGVLSFIG